MSNEAQLQVLIRSHKKVGCWQIVQDAPQAALPVPNQASSLLLMLASVPPDLLIYLDDLDNVILRAAKRSRRIHDNELQSALAALS